MIELLKLAGALGGFAGVAYFAVIYFIGREVRAMKDEIAQELRELRYSQDRFTRKDLLMLVASDIVHHDVKQAAEELLQEVADTKPPKRK